MRLFCFLALFAVFFSETATAQLSTYIVKLRNKDNSPFSLSTPGQYLSQRAIDRRTRYGIPIDSFDLPVNPAYIDSLRLSGNVSILNNSKWLNQVAIRTTDAVALDHINSLPFVVSVDAIAPRIAPPEPVHKESDLVMDIPPDEAREENENGFYQYGKSNGQNKLNNTDFLHNHGFRGKGMQLCVLDGGFYHYLSLPTFDSIRQNNQILGTWDFVNNEAAVNEDNPHGMQCLSAIAANLPGVFVGTAPEANFYLFRTENTGSEYPIEEQNLAAGWERADSLGVDVCSISLGYNQFDDPSLNYTYADMNGNSTISARAANLASAKGMMLVVAMGNEGTSAWHYLTTPADASSVMSVGAVDTLGVIGSFSSFGPNASGQVKPDVCATGVYAVVANTSTGMPSYGFGTSFACPNMAGITTCLWQAFPEFSNTIILETLRKSSNQFNHPDGHKGFGVPDAKQAFVRLQRMGYNYEAAISNCKWNLGINIKADPGMELIIERKLSTDVNFIPVSSLQNPASWGNHHYDFSDEVSAWQGTTVLYRIQMKIGVDTTYILDTIQAVIPENGCEGSTPGPVTIHPNPVKGNPVLQFQVTEAGNVLVVLYNAAGQRVYSRNASLAAGTYNWVIPMEKLAAGMYVLRLEANHKKFSRKVVKN